MKNLLLAIFISLLIHLTFFINFKTKEKKEHIENKKVEKIEKSDIKFVKLEKAKEKQKEILEEKSPINEEKKVEKKPDIKKTEAKNKIVEKKTETLKTPKVVKKSENKVNKKEIEKAKEFQKKILKEQVVEKKPTIQDKTLEDFLSQKEPVNQAILNELEKLYGKEYQTFTSVQKAFLEKNLNNFQVITQRVLNRLGYPRLAAKLKIGGVNIVEFMFHPNGDISGLKIINSSGYTILDDYTLELIKIAYKEYPKPKETTKLRFQTFYRLY